jgi:hypothetical protein
MVASSKSVAKLAPQDGDHLGHVVIHRGRDGGGAYFGIPVDDAIPESSHGMPRVAKQCISTIVWELGKDVDRCPQPHAYGVNDELIFNPTAVLVLGQDIQVLQGVGENIVLCVLHSSITSPWTRSFTRGFSMLAGTTSTITPSRSQIAIWSRSRSNRPTL